MSAGATSRRRKHSANWPMGDNDEHESKRTLYIVGIRLVSASLADGFRHRIFHAAVGLD